MLRVMQTPVVRTPPDGSQHITSLYERADKFRHQEVIDDSRRVSRASLALVCGRHRHYHKNVQCVNPMAASMTGGLVPSTRREVEVGPQDARKTTIRS